MKDSNTVQYARDAVPPDRSDWARVRWLTEEEIDEAARSDPNAQPTDTDFWKDADFVQPGDTEIVTLSLDREVVRWFRERENNFPSRINEILRAYVDGQEQVL